MNLLPNGSFDDGVTSDGIPSHWTTWIPAEKPEISVVENHAPDSTHSVSMRAATDLTSFLVSEHVPVAPGEKLSLSAWCRTEGLSTASGGSYGLNCGFLDQHHRYLEVAQWAPQTDHKGQWFQAVNRATVPEGAAYATFQCCFKMMAGRSWWSRPEMQTSSPLAIRFALASPSAEPGQTMLPLVLLNRDPSSAGSNIVILTNPGNHRTTITLGRKVQTTVSLPFTLARRGRQSLQTKLLNASGETLFSAKTTVTVPPLLVMEPVLPVYSCLEDGPPEIEGRIWVHEDVTSRSQLVLRCSIRGKDESENTEALSTWQSDPPLPENAVTYHIKPKQAVSKGDYVVAATLLRGDQILASATQDWHVISRNETSISLNSQGFPVVNGKPFFPIGLFDCSDYDEIARAGFNLTQNYDVGHVREGSLPDNNRMKHMLDQSAAAGMKHLFLVSHGEGCRLLNDEYIRRLRMFRDHPGVLCWYEEEGVARGDVKVDFIRDLYQTVKHVAPDHPLVIGDSCDAITRVTDRSNFFPADWMDIGIWWWYPIPIKAGGRPGAYEGEEETTRPLELVPPTFLTLAKTAKPIWVALQSYKKPGKDGRFPTPAEYRAQAYIAIIHGAKGLIYYTGASDDGVQHNKVDGHWEDLKKLITELREMSPVFMSPDAKANVSVAPSDALITWRLKDCGDHYILLVANRAHSPVNAVFSLPWIHQDENASVHGEDRTVPVHNGKFADAFSGYGVHIYELPKE